MQEAPGLYQELFPEPHNRQPQQGGCNARPVAQQMK